MTQSLYSQPGLFDCFDTPVLVGPDEPAWLDPEPDLFSYDHYIVYFSGGKDSLASLLHLLDRGVDPAKIELHHHDVDGMGENFMDWPVTPAYCRAVAEALNIPLFFSWKVGGFLREMLRENARTAPTRILPLTLARHDETE